MSNIMARLREAERHLAAGRLADAERLTASCLAKQPRNAQAKYLHGVVLVQSGRHDEGLARVHEAVGAAPKNHEMVSGLARLLERAGRPGEATAAFRKAASLAAGRDDYWQRLGRNLVRTGRTDEGLEALRKALSLNAKNAAALYSLGTALMNLGRNVEAEEALAALVSLQPSHHAALANLGVACLQQGKVEAAARHFAKAAALEPGSGAYHANLGIALMYVHRYEEAAEALTRATELDPKDSRAFANLSVVLQDQVRHDEALAAIRTAMRLDNSPKGPWDNLLMTLFYLPDHDPAACFRQHKAWGDGTAQLAPPAGAYPRAAAASTRPLRVGLVSPDFRTHPVAAFLAPILDGADRRRVTLVGFSQQIMHDDVTEALRASADEWHEIQRLNDEGAAALVRQQSIDILIDLAGHTTNNRLAVFARRPAPVQATYLGYPGTTGLPAIRYRLTDAQADPAGQTDAFHTERLQRLDGPFLCYRPPAYAPPPTEAPCIMRGHVTFGSFNNLRKLNRRVVAAWAGLLEQLPDARLLIKSAPLGDEATRERVLALFTARGIDPARLDLRGRVPGLDGHLAAYREIDIALDTFPYNGTTTTCEALWMSVPVVGLAGPSHVSRVGVSLLHAVGLGEFIGSTVEGYVRLAATLAADRDRLLALRAGLRERVAASPLTNERAFCDDFTTALETMWREHVGGDGRPSGDQAGSSPPG